MADSPVYEDGIFADSSEGNPNRPHPVAWREMHRWLEKRSVQELRQLAEQRGMTRLARRKAELVTELVARLAHPEYVLQALGQLAQGERATIELIYLLAADGHAKAQDLRKALLAWYGPELARDTNAYLANLVDQALVFAAAEPGTYRLPQAVLACLESLYGPMETADQATITGLEVLEYPPSLLPRTIMEIWQYCKDNEVLMATEADTSAEGPQEQQARAEHQVMDWLEAFSEVAWQSADHLYEDVQLPSPMLHGADLRAMMSLTGQAEEIVIGAFGLVLELGLATEVGQRIEVNELAMEHFRRHGETRQLQSLLSAWLASKSLGLLKAVLTKNNQIHLQRYIRANDFTLDLLLTDLAELRKFTARLIGLLEQNQWYTIAGLVEAVRALWPGLPFLSSQRGGLPKWRLAISAVPDGSEQLTWQRTYGLLFTAFLGGPLAWLGGIRLAHDGGEPVAFQLNSLGRYLCGHYPQLASHEGDMRPLAVADDLTVSIQLGRVDAEVHDFLSQFADLVEAESDVFRYRITPQQANTAFEDGVTLQEIISFLERIGGAPVPETAKRTLTQWYESYGTVRLYSDLTVIEFADDYALKELLTTTSLGSSIIYQLSPRMVVIDPAAVDELAAEMVRRGYTPKLKETPS